jgi:hypothetical protein
MRHNDRQSGFSSIEGLLIVIIVLLVGFIGYYVWHTQKGADETLNSAAKSAQSSPRPSVSKKAVSGQQITLNGGLVSFTIPKSWSSTQMAGICQTDNPIICVASSEVSPVDAQKAQAGDAFGVDIALIKVTDGKDARAWYFDDYLQAIQTSQ